MKHVCRVLISSSTEVFANLQVNDLKLCKAPPHDNITNKALKSMEGEGGLGWEEVCQWGKVEGEAALSVPASFPLIPQYNTNKFP